MGKLFTKKSRDGYVMLDHRESPGVTCEEAWRTGNAIIPIGGGAKLEAATFTCSKCQKVIVKNPGRMRERAYCRKCDHDVCDECGLQLKLGHVCTFGTCWHVIQVNVA